MVATLFDCYSSPPAFKAAKVMCPRANNLATSFATSGNALGSTRVGLAGQVILTAAGLPTGSTRSMRTWSMPIVLDASGVVKDGDMAEIRSVKVPGSGCNANRDRFYVDIHECQVPPPA